MDGVFLLLLKYYSFNLFEELIRAISSYMDQITTRNFPSWKQTYAYRENIDL